MVRLVRLALIASAVIYGGCGKKKSSTVAEATGAEPSKAAEVAQPAHLSTPQETVVDQVEPESETDVAHDEVISEVTADVETDDSQAVEEQPKTPEESEADIQELLATQPAVGREEADQLAISAWPAAYRMFLPTTAGPLIVDAEIRLDNELLSKVFDRRIDEVIEAAKADADAELTWSDFFAHVTGDTEQFGRQAGFNRGQYRQMTERFDRNRNGRPDHEEVARFLFRNSGINTSFRLIGTDHYREINRSQSPLFAAIDGDGNRALDEGELDAAAQALLRLDPNADQRIDPNEVIEVQENDPAWDRRRSNRRGDVAMDLAGYVDWSMVSYSIEAMRGGVPFSLPENPVERVDEDSDDSISTTEAKELLDGWPDLRLKIDFTTASASDQPTIEIVWRRDELEAVKLTQRSPSSLSLSDRSLKLLINATDRQANRRQIPREAFAMLDANNDGALEEDEIPDVADQEVSFEDLDADEDGKLTFEEVNSAPQKGPTPIWAIQVRARGAEFPDGVFAWLDTNHDFFLSTKEILNAGKRLRQCRTDESPLEPTDIPDTFAIQFMHADPIQDQQNFAFTSSVEVQSTDWPRWAQNMDVNRDGEISTVEFLGSSNQFEKLDTSGDGFIDSSEVAAASD